MKVESVDAFVLRAPRSEVYWGASTWGSAEGTAIGDYPLPHRRRYLYSSTVDTVLVRVRTGDGVTGWGECKAPVGPDVVAAAVRELLAPLVIGTSLTEIVPTWERMYAAMRVRGHDSGFWLEAIAGVDIALWDAWGHALGQPVSALLGGAFRESVPVYASGIPAAPAGSGSDGLRAVEEQAKILAGKGFQRIKVAVGVSEESDVDSVTIVLDVLRDRFGAGAAVYADAAGAYDVRQALRVGERLQNLGAGFFEMPVPPEQLHDYELLAGRLSIPIALDSLATRYRALQFLRAGALHVLQPDVCRAGGITETMRIAALADAFGAQATPHVSIGSAVHLAASLQCALAMPNCAVLEHWVGTNPLGVAIAPDLDQPVAGVRRAGARPGLGIAVQDMFGEENP
jgi:D-arabinonate dehydratase/D-galactarolactone cycloisomerase